MVSSLARGDLQARAPWFMNSSDSLTWYLSYKDWIRSICIFQVGSRLLRRTRWWGINACVKFVWTKRSPSCFYRVVIWFPVGIVLRPCSSVQYVVRLYAAQSGYLHPESSRKTWLQHQFLHVLFWHNLQKLFADPGFPVDPKILTAPGWSHDNHNNLNIYWSRRVCCSGFKHCLSLKLLVCLYMFILVVTFHILDILVDNN